MTDAAPTALTGPAPAMEIAVDMAKRAKWAVPVAIAFGAGWGLHGAASAAFGLLLVIVNFLIAAWMLSAAGRVSFAAMAGAAMFGYLIRLALIWGAVEAVRDASWVELLPLGVTIIVSHLALLMWEVRFVSGSFAYPGLKPSASRGDAPLTSSVDQPASAA